MVVSYKSGNFINYLFKDSIFSTWVNNYNPYSDTLYYFCKGGKIPMSLDFKVDDNGGCILLWDSAIFE